MPPDCARLHSSAWADYYPLTLGMSLVWLIAMATAMSVCLDALGCLLVRTLPPAAKG